MSFFISLTTSGRVKASAAMDTAKNSATCNHIGALHTAAISPATPPSTNQMDVSPAVAASATPKMMMAAIQIVVAISAFPPFRISPMMRLSAPIPSRTAAASHLFFGDRFVRNAPTAPRSVARGSAAGSGSASDTGAAAAGMGASWANRSAMDTW